MPRSSRHPREVRERAAALVLESLSDYGSQWEAIVNGTQDRGMPACDTKSKRWIIHA